MALKAARLGFNPCTAVDAPRIRSRKHITRPTVEQVNAFLVHVQKCPRCGLLKDVWRIAATTGLRRGELVGLAWEDIDLVNGRLTVSRSVGNDGGHFLKRPKSAVGARTIGLDPVTVHVAQRWAQTWQAVKQSTTWGELRRRVPAKQIDWITDTVLCNSINEHGPLDDRTLIGGLECALMETNTWPWHITLDRQTQALRGLPATVLQILDDEAENLSSTPDGVYIEYRDGERIAAAIRSQGIECVRNDQLIKQALGPLT
jgi:hypothetical protein